jgi:hypothetical protein
MKLSKFRSTNIKLLVAVVVLGATFLLGVAKPAEAHNYDTMSFWSCGATRPNATHHVYHSVPWYLEPNGLYVIYYCWSTALPTTNSQAQWHAYLWWNGVITRTDYCFGFCPGEPNF